jgi:hypothetical protein
MGDDGGATEGAGEGDVGAAMARAAAGSGADGAPLQLGPEGADVRACGGELTSQGLLACGFEFAPQAMYLLRKDREAVVRGGREVGASAGRSGGGSGTPESVEVGEGGASRVEVGSAEEEADGPREEELSVRVVCRVRRRRRRALASVSVEAWAPEEGCKAQSGGNDNRWLMSLGVREEGALESVGAKAGVAEADASD